MAARPIQSHSERVAVRSARATIRRLEERGFVREITGRSWGRAFEADEILRVLRGGTVDT